VIRLQADLVWSPGFGNLAWRNVVSGQWPETSSLLCASLPLPDRNQSNSTHLCYKFKLDTHNLLQHLSQAVTEHNE